MTDLLERYVRLCYTETDTRCGWTCPVMSYKMPRGDGMEQNMQGFTNTSDGNETVSYIEDVSCQTDCVEVAMAFAKKCHQGQTRLGRDGKVPYYDEHILGVYHILKD